MSLLFINFLFLFFYQRIQDFSRIIFHGFGSGLIYSIGAFILNANGDVGDEVENKKKYKK